MNEKQIQSKCVLWFSQEFPERRGDLFATFQETINAAQGSNMLSKGLIPGVSDLILCNSGTLNAIEMKAPNTYHDTIHILYQCRFIVYNSYEGWFCTSLDMFKNIVLKREGGINPYEVIDNCVEKINKSVKLVGNESIDDLIYICNKHKYKTGKEISSVKF